MLGWGIATAAFGFLVGTAELLSRYRDDPWVAILRPWAIAYLARNALASAGVFALLVDSRQTVFPELSTPWLALVSGFSGMALLRSKIFTVRTRAEEEVPVGLEAVVAAILQAADRAVDREQSKARWETTYAYLHDVQEEAHFDLLVRLLRTNLGSYQNVGTDELKAFSDTVENLKRDASLPVGLRCVAAGLAHQEIAGSENFRGVAGEFRQLAGLPVAKEPAPPPNGAR